MRFRIDLKIFIFIILFYFTKQIELYSTIMIFAFIHEIGHLIAGFLVGMKPEKLEIMPFGISISFKIKTNEYNKKIKKANLLEFKKIFVAIAGPLTNLIIIAIIMLLKINLPLIIYTNILIAIFNLLPIYPLDGGRILNGILYIFLGKYKAEQTTNIISFVTTLIITAIFSILVLYVKNIAIVIIDMYLWYLVIKERNKYTKRKEIYEKILENKSL